MSNNYRPDPFRDLFDDNELSSLFDDEDEDLATREDFDEDVETCPGCGGKGKYVGLFEIEDPCQDCGGTGSVRTSGDDRPRFPQSGS